MKKFTISAICLLLLFGCSSLPRDTVQTSERGIQAQSFMKLGNKYYRSGQYNKASAQFQKALASFASVDDGTAVATALCGLGRTRIALGKLDAAEACFQQARQSVQGLKKPDLEARALGGLGAVELHRDQPAKAIIWLKTALDLPLDEPGTTRATLFHDLGSAHRKLGELELAESYFRQALTMHESLRDLPGIAAACYSLALVHRTDGNIGLALESARRALNNDKKAENPKGVAQDLTLLGSLSSANGDLDQAIDYYRRANLAWQALGRDDQCKKITDRLQRIESP